jgi:hypothetical protein
MNAELFNSLLQQKEMLTQTNADALLQLSNQYPWFETAQVLTAIKLKQQEHADADAAIQKALLYVQHPLQLQQLINQYNSKTEEVNTTVEQTEVNDDLVLNAEATVEAVDTLITQPDEETDASLNAAAMVEAVDSIAINTDAETEAGLNAEAMIVAVDTAPLPNFSPLSNILNEPLKEGEDKLAFEPLHMVDYFASQGIKLKEEKAADDKLGHQLKTFTQWLKTMKKVYVEEEKQLDSKTEQAVVQMAGISNTEAEIVTEAMASVLEQQGKTAKAIELYRKLSLLHPEKSLYFAAQIERLNK